jgi:type VI secretion system protein ImpA
MIDVALLLEPMSAANPCGPDLEQDPDFFALEQALRGRPEQRMGAAVSPAVPPDWSAVEALAASLLTRTKDLRVAIFLARAESQLHGLPGLSQGLDVLDRLIRRFGNQLHPLWAIGEDIRRWCDELVWDILARPAVAPESISVREVRPALEECLLILERVDRTFRGGVLELDVNPLAMLRDLLLAARGEIDPARLGASNPSWTDVEGVPAMRQPSQRVALPELDALLASVSPYEPCGPNLEYDAAFRDLEQALAGRPERYLGTDIQPAVGPDWITVHVLATALFSRTKDLRVAVPWTRALTKTNGLAGAAFGLQLINRLLATWWTEVHPVVESDDPDLIMRRNILAALDARDGLLGDLEALASGDDAPDAAARQESDWIRAAQQVQDALAGIRATLSRWANDALPALWRFANEIAVRSHDDIAAGLSGRVAESSSDARDRLFAALCDLIDGADFDPAIICRRAHRIATSSFVDLVREVAPGREERARAFFGPPPANREAGSA